MKTITLGTSSLQVPRIGVGCMRIAQMEQQQIEQLIDTALAHGIHFFDHADIYGRGACESQFAKAVSSLRIPRDRLILQSKCGIVPRVMFDFSKDHILNSVNGILSRLNTDYLDVLLLHRPDTLVEPEEVAEAFNQLHKSGKVRWFGVSNQTPNQILLLQQALDMPLVANQLQFGPAYTPMISNGIEANMLSDGAVNRDGGILDFCRLHHITIQPWSPLQFGFFEGVFLTNSKYSKLNQVLQELGEKYSASPLTMAFAWMLRHPAIMQPITGTTNPQRLKECIWASDITITREEWYRVYIAAGNILP
jgi:predicted oxidoreductase